MPGGLHNASMVVAVQTAEGAMKSTVVVAVLVMVVSFCLVCESAAVAKQRRDADDAGGITGWLSGVMTNRRHLIPPV